MAFNNRTGKSRNNLNSAPKFNVIKQQPESLTAKLSEGMRLLRGQMVLYQKVYDLFTNQNCTALLGNYTKLPVTAEDQYKSVRSIYNSSTIDANFNDQLILDIFPAIQNAQENLTGMNVSLVTYKPNVDTRSSSHVEFDNFLTNGAKKIDYPTAPICLIVPINDTIYHYFTPITRKTMAIMKVERVAIAKGSGCLFRGDCPHYNEMSLNPVHYLLFQFFNNTYQVDSRIVNPHVYPPPIANNVSNVICSPITLIY